MKHKFSILVILVAVALSMGILIQAQEATPEVTPESSPEANIEFSGEVVIIDANTIQVAGLTVIISNAEMDVLLQDGIVVSIAGTLLPDGTIIAIEVDSNDEPEATPEPEVTPDVTPEVTPEITPEPDDDDGSGIIIVIEGPVESININIITIYSIEIELDDDDPILTVIQIGDVIRVEGELLDDDDDDTTILIAVINITFINVEVYINDDGEIWRDPVTCLIAPPPWAEANAWHIRCTTSSPNNGGGGRGSGGSSRSGGSSS